MREKLMQFMKALETAVNPPAGCHHAITFVQYGSDEDGWQDRLGLHVWMPMGSHRTFFLDDGDLEKPAGQLVSEIIALANQPLVAKG